MSGRPDETRDRGSRPGESGPAGSGPGEDGPVRVPGLSLRVFVGESDRHDDRPLHEWLVERARAAGLAGATVVRGIEGYGVHSELHTARVLRLSSNLPLVVEIVDERSRIEAFLPTIHEVLADGMAVLVPVEVLRFPR